MKQLKVIITTVGLSASVFSASGQAGVYVPLAADRYNTSPIAPFVIEEKAARLKVDFNAETNDGFQPFSENRYQVSPFNFIVTKAVVKSDVKAKKSIRVGFKPFGENRYH